MRVSAGGTRNATYQTKTLDPPLLHLLHLWPLYIESWVQLFVYVLCIATYCLWIMIFFHGYHNDCGI